MTWQERLIATAPNPQVAERVRDAIEMLLERDHDLLANDVNERTIAHRLAIYLEPFLNAPHVDCEYNRDGHKPKKLNLTPAGVETDDTDATTVFPDIIVHRRES